MHLNIPHSAQPDHPLCLSPPHPATRGVVGVFACLLLPSISLPGLIEGSKGLILTQIDVKLNKNIHRSLGELIYIENYSEIDLILVPWYYFFFFSFKKILF